VTAPRQSTLNQWVNTEALMHYAARLRGEAQRIADYSWPDDPAGEQAAVIVDLHLAAAAVEAAVDLTVAAHVAAHKVNYEWLYDKRRSWAPPVPTGEK
jgi:hypothetical protein